jgi:hypothetical protein
MLSPGGKSSKPVHITDLTLLSVPVCSSVISKSYQVFQKVDRLNLNIDNKHKINPVTWDYWV